MEFNLGVDISRPELFEQALLHRSYLPVLEDESYLSNERLEFLGDAILGMVVAEYLFSLHTDVPEGELTKMRSWLVNRESLAMCARRLNLMEFIKLSYSAEKSLQNGSESILADCLEAIIAAVYIDSGFDASRRFILNTLLPIMINKSVMRDKNYKSILLETVQSKGKPAPYYSVIEEHGPDHDKEFVVGVYVDDQLLATGSGKSKKQAEQFAARQALENTDFLNI
ncbi:MAG: ribonuclease III [Candidatus Kapaibacterium sp.]